MGTQVPFDRLVRAVDEWCEGRAGGPEVFGQIADPGPQGYWPRHFEWTAFVPPQEFNRRLAACRLLVAHAGMGSIISAQSFAKPVVIMPRLARLQEHRNDHQLATADQFRDRSGVWVAKDEDALPPLLDRLVAGGGGSLKRVDPFAEPRLLEALRRFVEGDTEE